MLRITTALIVLAITLAILTPACADGILLPVERPNSTIVIPSELFTVKYHRVSVDIQDQLCTTKVDQIFGNESGVEREGMYVFPMPEGSAITKFSMYAGEQEVVGKILDKEEARRIYESIVRQRKDPAILEYIDRNTFRARVYPIPAHGEKRVRLNYSEVIEKTGDTCRYVYPLSTERFSAKPLQDCKVTIKIKAKRPITNIYSPTHAVRIDRDNDKEALVTWEAENVKPDTDLVLYYTLSDDDIGIDLITHREAGEKGFYMFLASPRVQIDKAKIQPKDVVFVLDRTGSMAGEKIEQARAAMRFCLNSLRPQDRFNVITFNEVPEPVFRGLQAVTPEARKQALEAVDDTDATGGTNINDALVEALGQFRRDSAPNKYVIFVTDGLPTVGETGMEKILSNVKSANAPKAKVFVFGVGYDVNTHLLDMLANQNRGTVDYVRPREDIEVKVSSFFAKVSEPLFSDVQLRINGVKTSDAFPSRNLPDIFKGTQLVVFGRYDGSAPATVELSGTINGSRKTFKLTQTLPEREKGNEFIPQLWAARKIGYLLDEIRLHRNQELIDEVVRLSKEYGIPTEFTSFFADDRSSTVDTAAAVGRARVLAAEAAKTQEGAWGVAQSSNNARYQNTAQKPQESVHAGGYGGYAGAKPPTVVGDVAANGRVGWSYYNASDELVVVANVQNIARRTFYQRGAYWEDAQLKPDQKFVQIKQFSDAHFRLLREYPKLSQYSTLGNVRLVLENNQAIEIGPEGKDSLSDAEVDALLKDLNRGAARTEIHKSAPAMSTVVGLLGIVGLVTAKPHS